MIFVSRNLFNPTATCSEPARLADKIWTEVKSLDFACKPEIEVTRQERLWRPLLGILWKDFLERGGVGGGTK